MGSKFTFWHEHWADTVLLLDPDVWVGYAPLEAQEYEVKPPHQNPVAPRLQLVRDRLAKIADHDGGEIKAGDGRRDQARIATCDAALAQWRSSPAGTGNAAFYRLGCQLKATGMDDYELRRTLEQEAAIARSPAERRAQIPYIMKSTSRMVDRRAAQSGL